MGARSTSINPASRRESFASMCAVDSAHCGSRSCHIGPILITPDGKTCVFGYHRMLADLYLVEGLK